MGSNPIVSTSDQGMSRLVRGAPAPSTATCAPGASTPATRSRGCRARTTSSASRPRGSRRWCAAAGPRRASRGCTRTCSATRSLTAVVGRPGRRRPDAPGRVEVALDVVQVWRQRRRRAGQGRPPPPLAGGPRLGRLHGRRLGGDHVGLALPIGEQHVEPEPAGVDTQRAALADPPDGLGRVPVEGQAHALGQPTTRPGVLASWDDACRSRSMLVLASKTIASGSLEPVVDTWARTRYVGWGDNRRPQPTRRHRTRSPGSRASAAGRSPPGKT